MAAGGDHLLERTDELAVIDAALLAAQAGRGALTLVEGPPGIGKTELLAAAMTRAQRRATCSCCQLAPVSLSGPFPTPSCDSSSRRR